MTDATSTTVLTFDTERKGDSVIVHCHGKLVYGVCDQLTTKVKQLIPGSKCIVLDLTDLTHMDSMGLERWCGFTSQQSPREAPFNSSISLQGSGNFSG